MAPAQDAREGDIVAKGIGADQVDLVREVAGGHCRHLLVVDLQGYEPDEFPEVDDAALEQP